MSIGLQYNKITKYIVTAKCKEPMHIGNAMGNNEAVLVHPVDNVPFIQATSIAGLFRNYYKKAYDNDGKKTNELFGKSNMSENDNASDFRSRVRFGDGVFIKDKNFKLELRPRVSINPDTGACAESIVKGTDKKAGHKFNMEYIGSGAKFEFSVYLYSSKDADYVKEFETIFSAINAGNLQFGGQKSNGCGYIEIESLLCKTFDMGVDSDRKLWLKEESLNKEDYKDMNDLLKNDNSIKNAYEIYIEGNTEGELLVKSIAVSADGYGSRAPDCENIKNAQGDYIIPGSSFKGAIRNQMQNIALYLENIDTKVNAKNIIGNTFGIKTEGDVKGRAGNIKFFDTIVGDRKNNDDIRLTHRIHIDKFTGGVINGSLFTEKNVYGNLNFRIAIQNFNEPEKTCGLLIMALRDLAIGTMSVGGGYNVGKGIINVNFIKVECYMEGKLKEAVIDFAGNKVDDTDKVIADCFKAVTGEAE